MARSLRTSAKQQAAIREHILEVFTSSKGFLSVTVVLLGFLMGTLLILAVGHSPGGMYSAVIQVLTGFDLRRWAPVEGPFPQWLAQTLGWELQLPRWNARYIGEWLVMSMPLILCGFSMAFASRTGLFNIGAEGQYIAGLTAAQFIALYGPPVPGLHWVLAVAGAVLAGGSWGGLAGYLKARFNVSEVVATIMMNYIAFYISRYSTLQIPGANTFQTPPLPPTARLTSPFLASITNGSRLNYGLYLTVGGILLFWIIMGKTRFGYSLRATGLNKDAARYGGISVNASITSSMALAGAFAGLAGAVVSLGVFPAGRILSVQDGYGFDGIAVALVGNSTAGGTALAGLLFGMLKSAQPLMQSRHIPKEITSIIMGLVVVFISLRVGVRIIIDWQLKEKARKGRGE
ncbi:MAG: ABC transporter permease [Spirochaetaceae bacterium]|jgi:simple sugar transport system permease protein|nr:ABC transporter permease [Spirochaetaceae bacterium]